MDKVLTTLINVFFSWEALLIAFAVFAVLQALRKVLTRKDLDTGSLTGVAQNRWFRLFLPMYPYALALGLVVIPGVPFPQQIQTLAAKILFAIWAGFLSDKSYQIIKRILGTVFGIKSGACTKSSIG